MNIGVNLIISMLLSNALYTLYKKKKGQMPKGLILFAILTPIIGAVLSTGMSYSKLTESAGDLFLLLKNSLLLALILVLIPINILCIRHGFVLTGRSAKGTLTEAKKLIDEQKEEYKANKNKKKDKK